MNNIGVALCADGEYEQGIVLLRRAQSVYPDDPDLCCSLGNALGQHGDIEAAVHYLSTAIELDPDHIAALTILQSFQPTAAVKRQRQPVRPSAPPTQAPPPQQPRPAQRATVAPPKERRIQPRAKQAEPVPKAPVPSAKVKRNPIQWKRPAKVSAVICAAIACVGAGYLWVHRVVYGDKFIVASVMPDTLANRAAILNGAWSESAAAAAPDSARLLNPYYEITSTNTKGDFVGARKVDGSFQAFQGHGTTIMGLPPLHGESECGASSINDNGIVVGFSGQYSHHGIIWINGKPRDLNDAFTIDSKTYLSNPLDQSLVVRDGVHVFDNGNIIATATDYAGDNLIVNLTPKY